jgi:NAD(P)H-dependent FMN reductase
MSHRIAVVVGSLRRGSWNRALAHAVISLAPADFSFEFVEIGELPLYSQDYDADFPEVAKRFKQSIEAADALLFVTPEYNRSIPGVLKNALDWARARGGTTRGRASRARCSARRRARSVRRSRSSTCATCSRIST